jgi:hypothetical protein
MKNLDRVSTLRQELDSRTSRIKKGEPGIYRWWFKRSAAELLLAPLPLSGDELSKISCRDIDGCEYMALYFGISKDMLGRANWHITQKHSASAVKYGTISTLCATLSSLLRVPMSESESRVNRFIDDNCFWEWDYEADYAEVEREELTAGDRCYPLNIKENKSVSKAVLTRLKALRKEHKR